MPKGGLSSPIALCYANKLAAKRIVDVATLTGACGVRWGLSAPGHSPITRKLLDRVLSASKETGEYIWAAPPLR